MTRTEKEKPKLVIPFLNGPCGRETPAEDKIRIPHTAKPMMPDHSILQCRADVPVPHQEIWPLSVKENGDLLTPDTFKYCARVIHHELGNPLFHSHCLRHTNGTMLAEQGVNPKTIMERLGHKDIKTTLQVYTFNTEVMQQTAVDVLESAINR